GRVNEQSVRSHQRRRGGEQGPLALRRPLDRPWRHPPTRVRVPGPGAGGGARGVHQHGSQRLRPERGRQKIGDGDPNFHSRALRRIDQAADAVAPPPPRWRALPPGPPRGPPPPPPPRRAPPPRSSATALPPGPAQASYTEQPAG